MLDSLFNDSTIPLLEKVAKFSERRHEVLAGNLANINSPDYKTRDLSTTSFQKALAQAVQRQRQPAPANPGESLHSQTSHLLSEQSIEELFPEELFQASPSDPRNITFQDGGNRSVEHEIMEMTKNSMMQGLAIEMMMAQMNLLQAVISERA